METHENPDAYGNSERESIIQTLDDIEGIGRKTAEALYEIDIRSYADLHTFLGEHTTAKEISDALAKHGFYIGPGLIRREKWLASLYSKSEPDLLGLPVMETKSDDQAEQTLSGQKRRDHDNEFTVFFDVVTDEEGKFLLYTTVYNPKNAGEEKEFIGNEPSPWVNWMFERANLPISVEQPEVLSKAEAEAEVFNIPEETAVEESAVPVKSGADIPALPLEPYDAQITISDVQLIAITLTTDLVEKRLKFEISFQFAGADAKVLSSNMVPYQISIYSIELSRGTPALVASKDGQLEPNKLEYVDQLEFIEPSAGRYEFHNVVRLPPSGKLMGYFHGPTITISSPLGE
jgi:hypothetical protein